VDPPAQVVSGKPVRIQIPALHIDLQVAEGRYNKQTNSWTLSNDKAHYAVNTPLANNAEGNTFIYGHNRKAVFSTLNRIKAGDEAIVTTDNGHRFTYKFRSAYETNPTDNSLFDYKGAPILTVQTCSGLWYQNRQLFTFNFENVQ
jgi:LPXTG-site transpeptidase (sortase) family protein